jgi:Domain of unknown function (DUF4407)
MQHSATGKNHDPTPAQPFASRHSPTPPRFAWFAGVDLQLLALTPSEWSFYDALGKTVFLLACASGFAMAVAVGYLLQMPASHVAYIGVAWTVVVAFGIERLVLQLPSTRKRWLPVALVPRLALSLLLAVQLGEPLMMRINQDEIRNVLTQTHMAAIHAASANATKEYQPKIDADDAQIAKVQATERALQNKVERYRFLSACEANTPTCSTTGRTGCSTYCQHYARLADEAQGQLEALKPQDARAIAALRADIATKKNAIRAEIALRKKAIHQNTGLLAREHALASLERTHPEVAAEVWFLRLFFLALDLLPLGAKVLRLLTTDSPYEAVVEAARRKDGLGAKRTNQAVRVEERRILDQARADIEVNTISINLDKARRIDDAEATWVATLGPALPVADRQTIPAWDLGDFVDRMEPHERQHVPVPPGLRRGGFIGLALVGGLAGASFLWTVLLHHTLNAVWLPMVAVALVGGLAAYTRGFRSAPRWALRATFASLFIGLLLPLAVLGFNL